MWISRLFVSGREQDRAASVLVYGDDFLFLVMSIFHLTLLLYPHVNTTESSIRAGFLVFASVTLEMTE